MEAMKRMERFVENKKGQNTIRFVHKRGILESHVLVFYPNIGELYLLKEIFS